MSLDTVHGAGDSRSGGSSGNHGICRYLDTISKLERLTGFDLTADVFATAAVKCPRQGCRFEPLCRTPATGREPCHPAPDGVTAATFSSPPRGVRPAWGGTEPVAFARSAAIDMTTDDQGNRVERRSLKFDLLNAASSLGHFFQYWQWLRGATTCGLSDLDVTQVMRAGIIGRLHVVDVRSSDPGDFCFDLTGYAIPLQGPRVMRAHQFAIYADTTLSDYNTVRLTGAPRLQRIRAHLGSVGYHYTRLILPLLDKRRLVSHLAVAIERERGDGLRVASPRE
jgi:hypothetical protein